MSEDKKFDRWASFEDFEPIYIHTQESVEKMLDKQSL
jgi:hypothetical protein